MSAETHQNLLVQPAEVSCIRGCTKGSDECYAGRRVMLVRHLSITRLQFLLSVVHWRQCGSGETTSNPDARVEQANSEMDESAWSCSVHL
jgi:hypothetical protein